MIRNKAKSLSLIIFSLLISFPAIASDWAYVGSGKGFSVAVYVDKQSIKGDITGREFWCKSVFKEEQIDSMSGKYYIVTRGYFEIDCNNSVVRVHEVNYYSNDGENVNRWLNPAPSIKSKIVPDTVLSAVEKYVCGFKPTK